MVVSGRCLWIDASAGASGDMLLGALLDAAGHSERTTAAVTAAVRTLDVEPIDVLFHEVRRHGFRATKAEVRAPESIAPRSVADVLRVVGRATLPPAVATFATDVFRVLGEAEAHVHGEDPATAHLHEVGALDALADVVGCGAALDSLGLLEPRGRRIVVSAVALGSGIARSAHGELAVPAPAVLAILSAVGAPVTSGGGDRELCTPTGAALLATLAHEWGNLPPMRIETVGVGAGSANPPDRANVLRVVIGTALAPASGDTPWRRDDLLEVEATVDDLDPRLWPAVLDELMAAGALDAWLTPVVMRKGRPGHVVTALVAENLVDAAARALFAASTTLGLRIRPVVRRALPRDEVTVRVGDCEVRVKRGLLDGEAVTIQAEYADAAAAAERLGRPVRWVLEQAAAVARVAPQEQTMPQEATMAEALKRAPR